MNTIRLKKVYWWPKETIYLSKSNFRCANNHACRGVQFFSENNCSLLYDKKDYFYAPQEKQIQIVSVTSDENYEVILKGNIYFVNILFILPV